jgi:hypothetical protein
MTPTIKPTIKQHIAWQYLLDNKTKFIYFGGGAGGGKSWLGCEWLLYNCYVYPGSKWFIGREELKRLMSSSFITWTKVCKHHRIPLSDWKLNGQYNYIEFKNGSRIDLLDLKYIPSDPLFERLGSLEYTSGWIEEAAEIEYLAFDVLKSRIGRHMNDVVMSKMLLTCNPSKGWIYRTAYKRCKEKTLPEDTVFIQSLYKDNPHTAKEYGINLAGITDKATKERLMHGNWEYDDDPHTLFSYDALLDLFTNNLDTHYLKKYITADIARYGHDKTVIMLWEDWKVSDIQVYEKTGLDIIQQKISAIMAENNIPRANVVIDDDGVGGGVVDNLRGVNGFINNSAPIEHPTKHEMENYKNLRSQCYYMLADKVNNRQIRIESPKEAYKDIIIDELEHVKGKDWEKVQKLQIIPKEEIKEKLGRSPDFADALMMRMYFDLKKPVKRRTAYTHIP